MNEKKKPKPVEINKCEWIPPWRLLLTAIAVTTITYFPVGYHMVVLNVAHETFEKLINESYTKRYSRNGEILTHEKMAPLWAITVSSWQIGSFVGAVNAFWMADRFGRKTTLMVIAGTFQLIGSIFMILSLEFRFFELLIFGRFMSGIGAGFVCPILHVFLSECSPDRHRGTLNSFAGFILAFGVVSAMALGLPETFGDGDPVLAQLLLGFCLPLSILQVIITPFFPSTPKYLYLTKKNADEAKSSIEFYHGRQADVKAVFEELEVERILADQQLSFFRALRLKAVRPALIISIFAGIANSSVGVDIVDAYSTKLFEDLGLPKWEAQLSSIMFNVSGFVGSLISIFIIDRFARRTLLLSMLFVCFLCNVALIYVGSIGRFGLGGRKPGAEFGIAVAILIGIMELAYGAGPGAVLEGLFAEVSPHKVRAVAGSISKLSYCLTNWCYVFLFPSADVFLGTFDFLIHTIPSCVCLLYFAYYLPETGRKSVAEVAGEMLSKKGTTTIVTVDEKRRSHVKQVKLM